MYAKITDLINSFLGTHLNLPIQTYGFFVAMAFVTGGFIIYLELKRKEREKVLHPLFREEIQGKPAGLWELILTAIISFFIGFKLIGIILSYADFSANPQDYITSSKGNWIGGILIAAAYTYYTYYQKARKRLKEPLVTKVSIRPYQLTGNILIVAAIFGVAGAKLFDVIEHLNQLFTDPIHTLFSFSGLAFYGGFIVAAIAVSIYAERNSIPWPVIADVAAPGLMLAYGVGRIGCQLSGDGCWGVVNDLPKPGWMGFLPDWMWAFKFPHNVINEGIFIPGCTGDHCFVLGQAVFPTSFYETMMAVLLFLVLWFFRKKLKIPGMLFSLYLILNGIERFTIEQIRINIRYHFAGLSLTQAEMIAIGMMLAGLAGFYFFRWKFHRKQEA